MLAGRYVQNHAEKALQSGRPEIIAFGRPFIANPDLPERFEGDWALNPADVATFFGGGAGGYIDYPALA